MSNFTRKKHGLTLIVSKVPDAPGSWWVELIHDQTKIIVRGTTQDLTEFVTFWGNKLHEFARQQKIRVKKSK